MCFLNYFESLLEIESFERPSSQWQAPNQLFLVPVTETVVEVVDTVVVAEVEIVVVVVGSAHFLVDPSMRNLDGFSNPDCMYLSKGCSA